MTITEERLEVEFDPEPQTDRAELETQLEEERARSKILRRALQKATTQLLVKKKGGGGGSKGSHRTHRHGSGSQKTSS